MLIAGGQVMAGSIDVPLGAHILLNAVNGLFHHPLPRPRRGLPEARQVTAMMRQLNVNIPAPAAPRGQQSQSSRWKGTPGLRRSGARTAS